MMVIVAKFSDDYSLTRKRKEKDPDPSYGPKPPGNSSRSRPSNLRQPPITGHYQYCTAACLNSLKRDTLHPSCPNIREHRSSGSASVESVIEDVKEALRDDNVDLLGGGNSSKCLSIKTSQGYTLVVKVYNEQADPQLYKNEVAIYGHLSKLQGYHIPVIIGTIHAVFAGSSRDIIIMSYGGERADRCTVNNDIIDRIFKAFTEIHEENVRHQDISLHNILIDKSGRVAVIDFESAGICADAAPVIAGEQERIRQACEAVKASGNISDFNL